MAFEEVCPDRIDLIHKNYRKLCNLLIDVEEWGQVVIINMLTRYARTQFLNPNINVSNTRVCVYAMRTSPLLTCVCMCRSLFWRRTARRPSTPLMMRKMKIRKPRRSL